MLTQNEQKEYRLPQIEVVEMQMEQGFSMSNMEPIGPEKDEQEW